MDWYFLGAVKNYYLSQNIHENSRETVKSLFENLFHIVFFEKVLVLNDKLLVSKNDLNKIHNVFKYYIKSYNSWSRIHKVNFHLDDVKEVESYENDYILEVYTKNFVKPSLTALRESIERKMDNFKKHVSNLQSISLVDKIVSFDFEYSDINIGGISEVGISVYYPKKDEKESYHYIINNDRRLSKRRVNLGKEFRFGSSEKVSIEKAMSLLNREMQTSDFIIGHDLINEFNILNIEPDWDKIIDTKYCDVVLNKREQYFSLENILRYYGFKTAFLHNAGNDAAYVVDLLLKMKNQKEIKVTEKLTNLL